MSQALNIATVKVVNMESPSSGRPVANQYIVRQYSNDKEGRLYAVNEYFQSYKSIIAERRLQDDKIVLDETYWDYSVTTGKYRNQFLNENIAETRRKIKAGVYTLADLNA